MFIEGFIYGVSPTVCGTNVAYRRLHDPSSKCNCEASSTPPIPLSLLLTLVFLLSAALLATLFLLLCHSLLFRLLLSRNGLGAVVLRHGLHDGLLFLGLDDGDVVGEGLLGTCLAFGIGAAHDLDLDTEDTLSEENVTSGVIDEVACWLTRMDHEAVLR